MTASEHATARAAVDSAHAETERNFRLLADNIPTLMWRAGLDKACDWLNKPWLDFTGRTLEQELGFGWADGIHPDDYDRCVAFYTAEFEARRAFSMEYRLRRHDGEYRWMRDSGAPFFLEDGSFGGYVGSGFDVTDHVEREAALREAHTQQENLIDELNHRVKNTLATVQSIVAQTLRGADVPPRLHETLTSRIMALSKAHDVLTDEQWAGADLREIAAQAAVPYQSAGGEERFVLTGPEVRLPPKTAIAVALAFHELATNAAKYGALSTDAGRVELAWTVEPEDGHRKLRIDWRERGGPAVTPPSRIGFGTRLIERGLATDLQGSVVLAYPPEGATCTIEARLPNADAEQTTFVIASEGENWSVTAEAALLQRFGTSGEAISFVSRQLHKLRAEGRSAKVVFEGSAPSSDGESSSRRDSMAGAGDIESHD